jgi:enamine deaminase RidA (YjgF/YER057c/UK114 family)
MNNQIQHLNPDGLFKNPAFSQIITTEGNGKTIYIGGQNAVNADREIIGKGNIQEQTEMAMKNIQTALAFCNATFENVVKLSIHVVQGQNPYGAFQASQKFMTGLTKMPTISVLIVAGLANPDFLIEIDAIAFIPA